MQTNPKLYASTRVDGQPKVLTKNIKIDVKGERPQDIPHKVLAQSALSKFASLSYTTVMDYFAPSVGSLAIRQASMMVFTASMMNLLNTGLNAAGYKPFRPGTDGYIAMESLILGLASQACMPLIGALNGTGGNVSGIIRQLINDIANSYCLKTFRGVGDREIAGDFLKVVGNDRFRHMFDLALTLSFGLVGADKAFDSTLYGRLNLFNPETQSVRGISPYFPNAGMGGASMFASPIGTVTPFIACAALVKCRDGQIKWVDAPPTTPTSLRGALVSRIEVAEHSTTPVMGRECWKYATIPVLVGVTNLVSKMAAKGGNPWGAVMLAGGGGAVATYVILDRWVYFRRMHEFDDGKYRTVIQDAGKIESKGTTNHTSKALTQEAQAARHRRVDTWRATGSAGDPAANLKWQEVLKCANQASCGLLTAAFFSSMNDPDYSVSMDEWSAMGADPMGALNRMVMGALGGVALNYVFSWMTGDAGHPHKAPQDIADEITGRGGQVLEVSRARRDGVASLNTIITPALLSLTGAPHQTIPLSVGLSLAAPLHKFMIGEFKPLNSLMDSVSATWNWLSRKGEVDEPIQEGEQEGLLADDDKGGKQGVELQPIAEGIDPRNFSTPGRRDDLVPSNGDDDSPRSARDNSAVVISHNSPARTPRNDSKNPA